MTRISDVLREQRVCKWLVPEAGFGVGEAASASEPEFLAPFKAAAQYLTTGNAQIYLSSESQISAPDHMSLTASV